MSRVSDTRQRTREAAAKIVASGRRAHEVTVDLIYAEIRQGSRTTINDELKLWKDEQARTDALTTALPPAVASAMLALWASAVEHGERAFEERRSESESELAQAATRAEQAAQAAQAHAAAQSEITGLQAELAAARAELAAARQEARVEREAKDMAGQKLGVLEQRLAHDRSESQCKLDALRDDHEQQLRQQHDAHAQAQAAFREELARATTRLEGVQKHVMLQLDEARAAHKRTEALLSNAAQRAERLAQELEAQRTQTATMAAQAQRTEQDRAAVSAQAARLQAAQEDLKVQLARTEGQLEALVGELAELKQQRSAVQITSLPGASSSDDTPSAPQTRAQRPPDLQNEKTARRRFFLPKQKPIE